MPRSMELKRKKEVPTLPTILVFAHRRPRFLGYVLEGLRRQNALGHTQVWVDGHHEDSILRPKVEAVRALKQKFPEAVWMTQGARGGVEKLMIMALRRAVARNEDVIILEDDCFPAGDAIATMKSELDRVRDDAKIFSVYGHHFGDENGTRNTPAFQCWGWATTAHKLKPVLNQLARLWLTPEAEYHAWVRRRLTPEIERRMNMYPGRSSTNILFERFCWDATIAFLVAEAGLENRSTHKPVICNFGMGWDCGHFPNLDARFTKTPFSMMTEGDLVEQFDLHDHSDNTFVVDTSKENRLFFHNWGSGRRLLELGWCIPESWGTWSSSRHSALRIDLSGAPANSLCLFFDLRSRVCLENPELRVNVFVNGVLTATWQFAAEQKSTRMVLEVSRAILEKKRPAQLVFKCEASPAPAESERFDGQLIAALGLERLEIKVDGD